MIYDDDGNPINPALIPMPELCRNCEKKDHPSEKILCDLNRFDQRDESDFKCFAYQSLYEILDDDIIFESPK